MNLELQFRRVERKYFDLHSNIILVCLILIMNCVTNYCRVTANKLMELGIHA